MKLHTIETLTREDVRLEIKKYIDEHSSVCAGPPLREDDHCANCPLHQVEEEEEDGREEITDRDRVITSIRENDQFYKWFTQALQYNHLGQYAKTRSLLRKMYSRLQHGYGVDL